MSKVVVDISVSLDGYVTGPNPGLDNGLGDGGEVLHSWAFEGNADDRAVLDASFHATGAVIQGRRLFDVVDGPHGWSEEVGYGAQAAEGHVPPVFVLTHEPPATTRLGDRFRFVTDGVASAVEQAKAVAGDKDVFVMGGGEACHAVLAAGLADILRLHVAPVVLGAGTPLFPPSGPRIDLDLDAAISTPAAQHLTYRVRRSG